MKKLTANQIRQTWIQFFEKKEHLWIEPASLIPINDSSLLWINSGVSTLKDYFSGKKNPPSKRLVNCQKAVRTNDFFNVGLTSRHHTFFEMLGNFSIGDYFKNEAIEFAYELLINEFEIDSNLLWITVFKDDTVTYNKWIELGINQDQILKCDSDRNFWNIGSGPCGPCTEIYYDRGEKYDPNKLGTKLIIDDLENDRYVEIWNIVFSQFNNDGKDNYTELSRKNIDTGAGLERLACISQDVPTNFDTDLFLPIINELEKYSDSKYDLNAYFKNDEKQNKINFAYRVISDHLRASTFAIADGVYPSNKERGYILRRLIRRSLVFINKLNINEKKWLTNTINTIINIMIDYYPYLNENKDKIISILTKENELFQKTLNQGLKLFNKAILDNNLNDDVVFQLATTYGFPIELIKELSSEKNININLDEFNKRFSEHQKISNRRNNKSGMDIQNANLLDLTDESKFIYDSYQLESKIIKLFDNDFNLVDHLIGDGYVVVEQTPFYATSGGQIHDCGELGNYLVDDVVKAPNNQHLHHVIDANLLIGENVVLKINKDNRIKNTAHHSAEHLLQASLKNNIDHNIKQQGAFKSPEKLTFDFQLDRKLTSSDLIKVENWVNECINQNIDVEVLFMTLEEAKALNASAYFEDVYKKIHGLLRVIKIGDKSIELCGGTHVNNTNQIEIFKIINYISKGSGMWRIEAIGTFDNLNNFNHNFKLNFENKTNLWIDEFKTSNYNLDKLNELINNYYSLISKSHLFEYQNLLYELEIKVNQLKNQLYLDQIKQSTNKIKNQFNSCHENKRYLILNESIDQNIILNSLEELINEYKNDIFVIIVVANNKLQYFLATNHDNKNINLNQYINEINNLSDGKGGGKANFVRGGTNLVDKLAKIKQYLNNLGFKSCEN